VYEEFTDIGKIWPQIKAGTRVPVCYSKGKYEPQTCGLPHHTVVAGIEYLWGELDQ
jgi:hypothetical protein